MEEHSGTEPIDIIAKALVAAQKEMGIVGKSGDNKFDHYKYANLADYYKVCRDVLNKHGIAVVESLRDCHQEPNRMTKNNVEQYVTRVTLRLTFIHESGQSLSILSRGEGQDRGDKGTYKAITGARKYGIAMACNLVTSDDPEKDSQAKDDVAIRPKASDPPVTKSDQADGDLLSKLEYHGSV